MSDRRDAEDGAWGLGRSRVGMSEASDLIDVVLIPSNVYRYILLLFLWASDEDCG